MIWHATILGREIELDPALPLVKEANSQLCFEIQEFLRPPFWTGEACPYALGRNENSGKGRGHCKSPDDMDVVERMQMPFGYRLARGFKLLGATGR